MSEIFGFLSSVLRETANIAAQTAAYSWADDFARKEIREVWHDAEATLRPARSRRITSAQFWTMTPSEMTILGFARWDEESELRLIPLWAWNYIADGSVLGCIDGVTKTKGTDVIDLDIRFGCIAHGFLPIPAAPDEHKGASL